MVLAPSFLERIFKSLIAYESPDPYATLTHALYPSYHSFCMSVLNKKQWFSPRVNLSQIFDFELKITLTMWVISVSE